MLCGPCASSQPVLYLHSPAGTIATCDHVCIFLWLQPYFIIYLYKHIKAVVRHSSSTVIPSRSFYVTSSSCISPYEVINQRPSEIQWRKRQNRYLMIIIDQLPVFSRCVIIWNQNMPNVSHSSLCLMSHFRHCIAAIRKKSCSGVAVGSADWILKCFHPLVNKAQTL